MGFIGSLLANTVHCILTSARSHSKPLSLLFTTLAQSSDPDLWTLDLPPSQDTSVGYMVGARIHEDGSVEQGRENEDR